MARSEKNLTAVFTDTASAIRAKTGTTEAICPLDFADKINAIQASGGTGAGMKAYFEAGGRCGYSKATSFDGLIQYSDTENVKNFGEFFNNCRSLTTAPNINMSNATTTVSMFLSCNKLVSIPSYNLGSVEKANQMFEYCEELTELPELDLHSVLMANYMCYDCPKLIRANRLHITNLVNAQFMFDGCKRLEEVGEISFRNNAFSTEGMFNACSSLKILHLRNINTRLDISSSTLFERDALLEVINNLATVTSAKTLELGETNLAKLTDEDKAIATNKGWRLL